MSLVTWKVKDGGNSLYLPTLNIYIKYKLES